MHLAPDLNPDSVRRASGKPKSFTDRDFIETFITTTPQSRSTIVQRATSRGCGARTIDRYLKRLSDVGLIACAGGMYWAKEAPPEASTCHHPAEPR